MSNFKIIAIWLGSLLTFLGINYSKPEKIMPKIFKDYSKNSCDTSKVPEVNTLFEILMPYYKTVSIDTSGAIDFIIAINNQSKQTKLYIYNIKSEGIRILGDSLNTTDDSLNIEDRLAIIALFKPGINLYDRWAADILPFRIDFLAKRNIMFENLKSNLPKYNLAVIADIRKMDNQAILLKNGKSASPLSQHQFGLANDIAIKKNGAYLQAFSLYKILGNAAINQGLEWGGNFIGFPDPGHIQYFKNGVEMLEKIPNLRFEYEPFRPFYENRLTTFTKAGKAKTVEDTKNLLIQINKLNYEKICSCQAQKDSLFNLKTSTSEILQRNNIDLENSIIMQIDLLNKETKLHNIKRKGIKYKLGNWQ